MSSHSITLRDSIWPQLIHLMLWLITLGYISALFLLDQHSAISLPVVHFSDYQLTLIFGFDGLTQVMFGLVLTITLIIYQYAKTYLDSDRTRLRFLIQLCLVSFSVMLFVAAQNLLSAFVGWQLIGLNLYLLLNHYHYDLKANRAAKKKFIINRIGDLCFLVAVVIAYRQLGVSAYSALLQAPGAPWIGALLFIAVMTKSAQFPFHIWLPDTMETPTPVSALMHAGVINAGGVLLARMAPIVVNYLWLAGCIVLIGLISALLGTLFMRHQPDTKKQLAYSTMGQMGYMVIQCGLGAFSAAIFHLIAHGFYKATLFLHSGSTLNRKPQTKITSTYQQRMAYSILALGIALVFIRIAITLTNITGITLPLLLQAFIMLTIMQLCYSSLMRRNGILLSMLSIVTIALLLTVYIALLAGLSHWVNIIDMPDLIPLSAQLVMGATLIALQLIRWWMGNTIKSSAIWQHFVLHKGWVEGCYRRWLLLPLRRCGDQVDGRLGGWALSICLLVLALALFKVFNHYHHVMALPAYFVTIFIGLIIVSAIAANRARTLSGIFVWLLILQLSFTNLGLFDANPAIQAIGLFHLVNMAGVMLMLALLKFRQTKRGGQIIPQNTKNTLPWLMFYLSSALLLMIGIPGTASFISEFYILSTLASHSVLLMSAYVVGLMLLAIAILHALQTYVFDYSYLTSARLPLNPLTHVVCWLVIIINIINGISPQSLLGLIQTMGGA